MLSADSARDMQRNYLQMNLEQEVRNAAMRGMNQCRFVVFDAQSYEKVRDAATANGFKVHLAGQNKIEWELQVSWE